VLIFLIKSITTLFIKLGSPFINIQSLIIFIKQSTNYFIKLLFRLFKNLEMYLLFRIYLILKKFYTMYIFIKYSLILFTIYIKQLINNIICNREISDIP